MKRIVAILALICACHASFADTSGDWTYTVSNNQATITGYTGAGGAVTIPSSVNGIAVVQVGNGGSPSIFGWRNTSVTEITIPSSVKSVGDGAFEWCTSLATVTMQEGIETIGARAFLLTAISEITLPQSIRWVGESALIKFNGWGIDSDDTPIALLGSLDSITMPDRLAPLLASMTWFQRSEKTASAVTQSLVSYLKLPKVVNLTSSGSQYLNNTDFINSLANNDDFVTAVANKIKATSGNYGIATQSGVTSSISSVINEGRIAGVASVTASPNTWSLFTASQIQNMAIGDLVLTREVNGNFVLNYDIEQSNDLANWTVYSANTQIVKLPADKAFVRIKAKQ